jgi:hypothetical protein
VSVLTRHINSKEFNLIIIATTTTLTTTATTTTTTTTTTDDNADAAIIILSRFYGSHYRRGLDWQLDLLDHTTVTHNYSVLTTVDLHTRLHFTVFSGNGSSACVPLHCLGWVSAGPRTSCRPNSSPKTLHTNTELNSATNSYGITCHH